MNVRHFADLFITSVGICSGISISQGMVVTLLRCGGIFSEEFNKITIKFDVTHMYMYTVMY